jgi:glycosyltransferase involved in cell wall biosynthesis
MPGLGGPARSLAGLLEGLGTQVERVAVVPPGRFAQLLIDNGLAERVVVVPPSRIGRLGRLHSAWLVAQEMRAADVLHCNGHTEFLVASAFGVTFRRPVVSHMRTTLVSGWSARVGRLWSVCGDRAHWVAVSSLASETLATLHIRGRTLTIVPNPISLSSVTGPPKRARDAFTVGYFGSRRTVKGFRLLPEIARALNEKDITLRVYTDPGRTGNPSANDDVTAELESMGSGVELVGHQSDLRGEYTSCNAILAPSLRESFGRVPVEALANGIPVVASRIAAFSELAEASGAIDLFDLNQPSDAATVAARLRNNPERYALMASRGRPFAERFDPQRIAASMLEVYQLARREHGIR